MYFITGSAATLILSSSIYGRGPPPLVSITVVCPMIASVDLTICFGVMLCFSLYLSCFSRLRSVSSIVRCIECVILSAYMMTLLLIFLAARPAVWVSDFSERRNPSLSASRIATNDTSGRSRPSRNRLIPTRTSKFPNRKSRIISTRSSVCTSE